MSTFLGLIPLEMNSLDKLIEPEIKFDKKRDHEVGIMSDDLKKLFTLWRIALRAVAERNIEAKFSESEEKRQLAVIQACELQSKALLLGDLFWIAVKDEFDLWAKPSVGVRQGYRIVWWNDENQTFLGNLFKHLTE